VRGIKQCSSASFLFSIFKKEKRIRRKELLSSPHPAHSPLGEWAKATLLYVLVLAVAYT